MLIIAKRWTTDSCDRKSCDAHQSTSRKRVSQQYHRIEQTIRESRETVAFDGRWRKMGVIPPAECPMAERMTFHYLNRIENRIAIHNSMGINQSTGER